MSTRRWATALEEIRQPTTARSRVSGPRQRSRRTLWPAWPPSAVRTSRAAWRAMRSGSGVRQRGVRVVDRPTG